MTELTYENTTNSEIDLGEGFVVASGGSVVIPAHVARHRHVKARLKSGDLVEASEVMVATPKKAKGKSPLKLAEEQGSEVVGTSEEVPSSK
jgi:hypothetical protein